MCRNKFRRWGLLRLAIGQSRCPVGQLIQLSLGQLVDRKPGPAYPNCWTSNNCIAIPVAQCLASMKCCFLRKKRSVSLIILYKYVSVKKANFQKHHKFKPLLTNITNLTSKSLPRLEGSYILS